MTYLFSAKDCSIPWEWWRKKSLIDKWFKAHNTPCVKKDNSCLTFGCQGTATSLSVLTLCEDQNSYITHDRCDRETLETLFSLTSTSYTAESSGRQHKANPVFWLATQAGKMRPFWPPRFPVLVPRGKVLFWGHIITFYWSSFFSQDSWIMAHSFLRLFISRSIKTQKNTRLMSSHLDFTLCQTHMDALSRPDLHQFFRISIGSQLKPGQRV